MHIEMCVHACIYILHTNPELTKRDVPFVSVSTKSTSLLVNPLKNAATLIKQGQLGLMWVQHCMHAHN